MRSVALVLAASWAIAFAPQLFMARGFVIGDASNLRAYAEHSAAEWREHHRRALWNPYVFGGIASAASLQDSRPQWLPDPLLSAFDAIHRVPGFPPLAIPLAAHLAGMIAVAALVRARWRAGTVAASAAGLVWGLQPNLVVPFAFGHDAQLMACALMPVVLLAIEAIASARARVAPALGLALAVACELMAAHPQITVLTAGLAAAYALERAWSRREAASLAWIGGGALLGAMMASAVWWPALLYNAESVRAAAAGGVGAQEVSTWSLAWRDLVAQVWPRAVGFGGETYWGGLDRTDFPPYLGLAAALLAGLGFVTGARDRRSGVWFWAITAVIGMLLALGTRLGPIHQFLYEHVPMWSAFRVATNTVVLTELAVAVLAARGIEDILSAPRTRRPFLTVSLAVVGAVGIGVAIGPLGSPYADAARLARPALAAAAALDMARHSGIDLLLRVMLACVACVALIVYARSRTATATMKSRALAALALLLIAGDLMSLDVPFLKRGTGRLETLAQHEPPPIARLAAHDSSRVLMLRYDLFFGNDWIRWRARSMSGFHPAVPRSWDALRRSGLLGNESVLAALGVRYIAGEGVDASDTTRFAPAGDSIWRLKRARARISTVQRVLQAPDEKSLLGAIASPDFDPRAVAVTTDAGAAAEYPGSIGAAIHVVDDASDHLALDVTAAAPAFVVVADADFSGWRARIDGAETPIHRVDAFVRGVRVASGSHRLVMHYEPPGAKPSRVIAWVAWIAWIVATAASAAVRRRARKSRPIVQ
jgi:hypothetical protein